MLVYFFKPYAQSHPRIPPPTFSEVGGTAGTLSPLYGWGKSWYRWSNPDNSVGKTAREALHPPSNTTQEMDFCYRRKTMIRNRVLSQWDVSLSISVRCYGISLGLSLLFKKGKGIDSKLLSNGGPGLCIQRNGIIHILLYYPVLFIHSWMVIVRLDCKSMACMAVENHVGCCEDVVPSCLGAWAKLPMHLVPHPPNSTLTDTQLFKS